jgi:three-Cys-motif partner protein
MIAIGMAFDDIGPWSEIKLEIIRQYAAAYSAILTRQRGLHHVCIDAFAGAGVHVTRSTREYVAGSPLNALLVQPPFEEYFLIDLAPNKVTSLQGIVGDPRPDGREWSTLKVFE